MYRLRFIYILFGVLVVVIIITLLPVIFTVKKATTESAIPPPVAISLIERLLIIGFYSLILSFIIALFFGWRITGPLNLLKRSALRVRSGELDFEISRVAIDEFDEVIKTFNTMLKSLKEKTEELRKKEIYIEKMIDPLIVIDGTGIIEDINPACTGLLGYERDEIIGLNIGRLVPSFSLTEGIQQFPSESEVISKTGETIPVLITASRVILNNSEKILLSLRDFREGLAIREEIKLSRDYLESIMNSIQDELLVIDRDFRVIKANDAVRRRIGTNPEGKFCYAISHLLERPCEETGSIRCPAKIVFETKRSYMTEHEHIDSAGNFRIFEVIAYPVIEENGKLEHVIEFMRDITDRKRIEDELRKKNRELSLLNEVSTILSRSLRADEIFNSVLAKLKETFGMDGGGIFILEKEILTCKYHSGISEEFVRQAGRVPLGHDIPGKVAQSGIVLTSVDISKDQRIERSILRHSGIRGYCCIPVKGKERILGVFCLFSFKPYQWTSADEDLLKSLGEMMGLAFENISLYERLQSLYRTLKDKRQKEIEDLSIMVDTLSGTRDIEELLDSAMLLIKERLNPDLICLVRSDDSGNLFLRKVLPESQTSPSSMERSGILYNWNVSSQESLSIRESVIIHVRDITQEPRFYYHEIFKTQYVTSLTIPLSSGEKNIGALSLYSKTPRDFTEEEIHFLKIFSAVLSLSLERSESYEILLRQEALSSTILDSIEDGVYTVDRDGYITTINRAAEEIFNLRRTQVIGKRCKDLLLHGAEKPLCDTEQCPLRLALSGRTASSEIEYTNPKGKRFILEINCLPLRDPSTGEVRGAVQVFWDVTRQRELDRIKTEIIRSVSHEFRTPLTAIIGMTEMILSGDVKEERVRQYLEIMHREGLRLSRMIAELLDISKLERRELLKIGPVDFRKIVENIKISFSDIIEKKNALVAFNFEGDLSGFKGDEEKIEQMIRNLIDNSLNYSDSGVRITVHFKKVNDMIEITVSDTGWGIPEEDIPHLGERFYRGRHGERTKGTGLGLSLVKEIVKIHGGVLTIDSKHGKGTSVKINLPVQRGIEQ